MATRGANFVPGRQLIHFVFAPGDPSLSSKFAIFFPAPNRYCEEGGSKKATEIQGVTLVLVFLIVFRGLAND